MKGKLSIFILGCFFTFFYSCKDEKSIDNLEVVKPPMESSFFKVTLNVILKKDDDFSLFYTTDGSTDFKIDAIWQAVKGSSEEQEIKYTLPQNTLPTQLRLDFGLKQDQEDIVLKSVVLEYKDKKREINGAELMNFFRADLNKCTFDANTGVIKAVIIDGKKQSPSLYPQEAFLGPELKKLVN